MAAFKRVLGGQCEPWRRTYGVYDKPPNGWAPRSPSSAPARALDYRKREFGLDVRFSVISPPPDKPPNTRHSAIILSKALLPFSCFIAYLVAYFSAEKTPG